MSRRLYGYFHREPWQNPKGYLEYNNHIFSHSSICPTLDGKYPSLTMQPLEQFIHHIVLHDMIEIENTTLPLQKIPNEKNKSAFFVETPCGKNDSFQSLIALIHVRIIQTRSDYYFLLILFPKFNADLHSHLNQ